MRIVLEVDLLQCTALSKVNSVDTISQNVTKWSNWTLRRDCKKPDGSTKHNAKPAETILSDSESDNGVFTASSESSLDHRWLIDSGATSHMTHSRELLVNYRELEKLE